MGVRIRAIRKALPASHKRLSMHQPLRGHIIIPTYLAWKIAVAGPVHARPVFSYRCCHTAAPRPGTTWTRFGFPPVFLEKVPLVPPAGLNEAYCPPNRPPPPPEKSR